MVDNIALGTAGLTTTPPVVADHPVIGRQVTKLVFPHPSIGNARVRKDHRRALASLVVADLAAVYLDAHDSPTILRLHSPKSAMIERPSMPTRAHAHPNFTFLITAFLSRILLFVCGNKRFSYG